MIKRIVNRIRQWYRKIKYFNLRRFFIYVIAVKEDDDSLLIVQSFHPKKLKNGDEDIGIIYTIQYYYT